jgi:hypothetical protein
VAGQPARHVRQNENRQELIAAVIHHIRTRPQWDPLDAVLFPAGFFRLDDWFGPLSPEERWEQLDWSGELDVCRSAARKLSWRSPGCLVVAGFDTNCSPQRWRGDQMVAAYDASGLVALTRKIFPVDGDTNGWGRSPYLLFAADAEARTRIIELPNGERAILSACYDAFVFSELAIGPTAKRRAMRWLGDAHPRYHRMAREEADRLLGQFARGIHELAPTISLAAIHGFERPGGEIYWQRHGLATASAALCGLSVGAAHFRHSLPANREQSPLAADQTPYRQLRQSHNRRAYPFAPIDGFEMALPKAPSKRALVRLYRAT